MWWVLGAVIVAAVIVGVLVQRSRSATEQATVTHPTSAAGPHGGVLVGDTNAPVTITEYGDFQCPGCDELHREGFKRPEVLAEIGKFDMVRFVPSDLSAIFTPGARRQKQKVAEWARTLNLGYVPTIIFFDSRGREVFRVEAYVRPFHLAGAFEYVSSGAYTTEPSFQRFLQAKAERLKKGGATVDLWN